MTFTYTHRRAIQILCVTVLISVMIAVVRGSSPEQLEEALYDALIVGLLIYIFCYSYLLNTSFSIERDKLVIRKRIGRNRSICFAEVRRYAIREEEGSYGMDEREMTLYTQEGKSVIKLDGLSEPEKFTRLLEQRIKEATHRDLELLSPELTSHRRSATP